MWRKPACQALSKALDISSATAQAAPELLKALAILADATVRRYIVDRDNLKPYWKSENRSHFSRWSIRLLFTSFSKTLLAVDQLGTLLNTGTTDTTFQQSGKQDSFRQILKRSASLYEISGSQFLRSTTGIQSGPYAIDQLWRFSLFFINSTLTVLGVTEILCSFRLVLEGKVGTGLP